MILLFEKFDIMTSLSMLILSASSVIPATQRIRRTILKIDIDSRWKDYRICSLSSGGNDGEGN